MKKLSLISHYYNYPEKVLNQIRFWETLPADFLNQVEFILVDDCSEQQPVFFPTHLDLRVYRITSDILWNQAGARNLGTFHASGEWGLFFDIDQRMFVQPMSTVLANLERLNKQTMYYFQIKELIDITNNTPLLHHPNTFMVHLAQYREWGMYDEDFAGHYGYEDIYMPRVWERHGGNRTLFNDLVFFEDTGFGTFNLDRDLTYNLALAQRKLQEGTKNSPGILRFDWVRSEIPSSVPDITSA